MGWGPTLVLRMGIDHFYESHVRVKVLLLIYEKYLSSKNMRTLKACIHHEVMVHISFPVRKPSTVEERSDSIVNQLQVLDQRLAAKVSY